MSKKGRIKTGANTDFTHIVAFFNRLSIKAVVFR
jgi:hypothetical protein